MLLLHASPPQIWPPHRLLCLLFRLFHFACQGISLGLNTLLSSLAGSLGLGTFGVHLLPENALTLLLGLGLMDLSTHIVNMLTALVFGKSTYVLNQRTLVLECITLTQVVEFVVKVLVDFASGAILDEETTEDS
jgi:hypothetical protein